MRLKTWRYGPLGLALLAVASCVSAPVPEPERAPTGVAELPVPPGHVKVGHPPAPYTLPAEPGHEALYASVPGWTAIDPRAGLSALSASCEKLLARPDDGAAVSERAAWAGRVGEWRRACQGLATAPDMAAARAQIEARFVPVEVIDPAGEAKFTGYFEPIIEARRRPEGRFTAPIPGPPGDLVVAGDARLQRLAGGGTRPYPPRAAISPDPAKVLGYAHPADVFFLQIQGSGRLVFENGSSVRAAYHAHNGHPFRSTANWLIEQGEITRGEASMQGIRAWMDRAPDRRVREAMNANPRYVFFEARPITDPARGPVGAQNVPLTALGSMAVDPDFHALGVPYVVETTTPALGGVWRGVLVAQDTGGAIKGPVRGDIFFGTGEAAGQQAGTMNTPGRMWALLPPAVAERLRPEGTGEPVPVSP